MQIVTSQNLITKHGPGIIDTLKQITPNITVLQTYDADSVKAACRAINDTILIVGNHDVIPFYQVPNPTSDADANVFTDNPYASADDNSYYVPCKVIARLPDEGLNLTPNYLETVIANQLFYLNNKSSKNGWANVVASVWTGISTFMKNQFNMNDQNICPPTVTTNFPAVELTTKKLAYINLHGTQDNGSYYGQQGMNFPEVMNPTMNNGDLFNGCLVYAEACYGGFINTRNKSTSIPLNSLYNKAIGFVGSTSIAYGPSDPPADGADLIGYFFFQHINKGENIGSALLGAKHDSAAYCINNHGMIDGSNKKSLLQFTLYGIPTITL